MNSVTAQPPLHQTVGYDSLPPLLLSCSDLASPPSILFCVAPIQFLFFGMVVAGEVGFLLREKLTEFLVPIRWTRFCQNYFLGEGFGKTETDFPPAERGLGNECGRAVRFVFWRDMSRPYDNVIARAK